MLQLAGVQLVPFSPLHDRQLPPGLSGVLLGGGAVAQHAAQLSCNTPMLEALGRLRALGAWCLGRLEGCCTFRSRCSGSSMGRGMLWVSVV